MKKKLSILLIAFILISIFSLGINVNAKSNYKSSYIPLIMDKKNNNKVNKSLEAGNNSGEDNCNSLLGSVKDPESVAWLLWTLLNFAKVLGPLSVVVLSAIDFTKNIIVSDDEALKKSTNRLKTRILLIFVLFLLPEIIKLILSVFGIVDNQLCALQ